MTIKEIAKLANVSASTVSKILSGKDKHISEETRSRVTDIVDRYQYSPKSKALRSSLRSHLIGAIVPDMSSRYTSHLLRNVEKEIVKHGFNLAVCNTGSESESEDNALNLLVARRVECLIIMDGKMRPKFKEDIIRSEIPYILLNSQNIEGVKVNFDYQKAVHMLMKHLIDKNHQKIALIIREKEHLIKQHYRQEIEKNQRIFDDSMIFDVSHNLSDIPEVLDTILRTGYRAVLAESMIIAEKLCVHSSFRRLDVGKDFSLAAIDDQNLADYMTPALTCAKLPFEEYALTITNTALQLTEGKDVADLQMVAPIFFPGTTVGKNIEEQKPRIAVVGTINMDVMMEVAKIPCPGETVVIREKTFLPGGKGANQAVGAAKLGAKVSMIGRLGNDLHGKELYQHLYSADIDLQGVSFDNRCSSGWAYIYVTDKAEYASGIHSGANIELDREHIGRFKNEIIQASYCLAQTEISMNAVEYLGELCAKNHVRLILKPSSAEELSEHLLRNIYMLIPSKSEINRLIPKAVSLEEKVEILIQRGAPRVILTLGERGCYYSDGKIRKYFKAAKVNVVDTMGASDAFISALAVYLAEGRTSMDKSITYANIAAGLSVSQIGVQAALPDRNAVEIMYRKSCVE